MIKYFKTQNDFGKWLEKNHNKSNEIYVGFFKVHTKNKSVTYSQALDEALCFGWIDGIRKSIDEERYHIRFTPRRKESKWSNVNIKRAKELIKAGKMKPAGLKEFENRKNYKSVKYSYEEKIEKLSTEYGKKFKENKDAFEFFQIQAPYYKRIVSFWIMSAKKEETRQRRLNVLINDCEKKRRIDLLNPKVKSKSR
ncbi:MAG: YdeI/OmpD-associated family protein [bacterium]|nr:YdeI/OmpD-associated family protein [bacterium]